MKLRLWLCKLLLPRTYTIIPPSSTPWTLEGGTFTEAVRLDPGTPVKIRKTWFVRG